MIYYPQAQFDTFSLINKMENTNCTFLLFRVLLYSNLSYNDKLNNSAQMYLVQSNIQYLPPQIFSVGWSSRPFPMRSSLWSFDAIHIYCCSCGTQSISPQPPFENVPHDTVPLNHLWGRGSTCNLTGGGSYLPTLPTDQRSTQHFRKRECAIPRFPHARK